MHTNKNSQQLPIAAPDIIAGASQAVKRFLEYLSAR